MTQHTRSLTGLWRQPRCAGRHSIGILMALMALILAWPLKSQAQILYASLTGNVTDPSGAPIPGAKVEARNVGTGIATEAVTNSHGIYLITHLQPGTYKVAFSATSFGTVTEQNVRLVTNNTRRVDIQLQLAGVSQRVTVKGAVSPLQTDRADIITNIGSTDIENLPLGINRNYESLYALVPGVSPPQPSSSIGIDAGNPTGSMILYTNGTSALDYNSTIDGAAVPNFWEEFQVAYVPPAAAIQAVNMVTGSFDAELGKAGGSVSNVVTKSGTDAFHGAAWEYNTSSALEARNFFYYAGTPPKFVANQFGLDLGGPIKKDKLFFFGDWQRYVIRESGSGLYSLPTEAIRNGDFSGSGTPIFNPSTGNPDGTGRLLFPGDIIPSSQLSSAAQKMAALIPAPNFGSGISNNYFSATDYAMTQDTVDLKLNYNPTSKSSIFGRYSAQPTLIVDPPSLGPAGGVPNVGIQPGRAPSLMQNVALGGTYTIRPNMLLDANAGFLRQGMQNKDVEIGTNFGLDVLHIPGTNGPNPLQGGIPGFNISGFAGLGDLLPYNPFVYHDNEYTSSANLSWIKGSHSLRFGFFFGRFELNHFQPQLDYGPRGGFTFTGGLTALNGGPAPNEYNGWADFLLGLPQAMGKDYQYIDPATSRENEYSFYARDQWQVTRKLSLDVGARYERYPFPSLAHFGGLNYNPATNLSYLGGVNGVPSDAYVNVGHGQLSPRLGLAYRLNKKTVVRAGFGMSTDASPFACMLNSYPMVISQQIAGITSYMAAGSLATGLPPFTGPDLSLGKFELPTYLGTEAFPVNFRRGYVESYSFTVQRELGSGFNAQAAYVGTRSIRAQSVVDVNAAGPGAGTQGAPLFKLWGNPNDISEITPFGTAAYNSLQAQATWRANGKLVGAVYTLSKALDYTDIAYSGLLWSWEPMLSRNYAPAGYDQAQNFRLYAVYALPFGPGHSWATHGIGSAVLGGWKISPILSRLTGLPFTITSSGASANAPGSTQTADQVLAHVSIPGGHGPGEPYFNPNAFAPVTAVRFGTSGRDILFGPGFFNLDASISRDFKIKERFTLEFRAEAYGLTNTPQFAIPSDTAVSDASFTNGTVTSLNGYDTISSATGQRQIRFALKLSF
ncbi:MAG: TonB-dependent receptor domain-containing protein [Terriglobia bacterium]